MNNLGGEGRQIAPQGDADWFQVNSQRLAPEYKIVVTGHKGVGVVEINYYVCPRRPTSFAGLAEEGIEVQRSSSGAFTIPLRTYMVRRGNKWPIDFTCT